MVNFESLPGSLDLFELLVNYIFGSIFLSILGWAIILLVVGIMGRLSLQTLIIVMITYFLAAMIGYIGALAAVPIFIMAFWYMTVGILNKLSELR